MGKICEMKGVREYVEEYPVELWRDDESGRLVVRAENEGGCNAIEIDLLDLAEWLKSGPQQYGVSIYGVTSGGD